MSEKFFYSKREFLRFSTTKEKFLEEDIEREEKSVGYYGYSLWNVKQYHFPFAISTGGR